jgi:hypothetical protein
MGLAWTILQRYWALAKEQSISTSGVNSSSMYIASEEFFEARISKALETRSFGLDLFFEAARNEALRKRMTEIYEQSYAEFAGHIEKMKNEGIVKRSADVSVVWRGLVALRDGLISSVFLGENASNAKKIWEKVANILLNEILAKGKGKIAN